MTPRPSRYLAIAAAIALLFVAATGLLNAVVDPLWFFGGNKIQGRNYPFDERTARIARFTATPPNYDCFILGASRVGLMNEKRFKGHDCFMFSFASATPQELVAVARYAVERQKTPPTLVIVGVDDFDFLDQADVLDLPAPVVNDDTPHFWQYYFSLDVAFWSIKTLLGRAPLERYYGADLTGRVLPDAEHFKRLRLLLQPGQHWHMSDHAVAQYALFREIFPKAHLVAYATPVAASRIARYERDGLLPAYLQALHEVSAHFDEMYDFSIPSAVTTNRRLTYDGSHFYPPVGDRIAAALQAHQPDFGIRLTGLPLDRLAALYRERLAFYAAELHSGERTAAAGDAAAGG